MNTYNVSCVIVTHNRLELLQECIQHLQAQTYQLSHIVIVDNDSDQPTKQYLESIKSSQIIVYTSTQNLGGAGGFEIGLKEAFNQTNDNYFWILDDDTIPTETALEEFVKASSAIHQQFGFLCSDVRWTNSDSCNVPVPVNDWNEQIANGLIGVKQATFVSILVSRTAIEAVGFPIGSMFIWGDDTEYTRRLSRYQSSYYVIKSVVVHKTVANVSTVNIFNDTPARINRYFYLYRNVFFISKKYDGKLKTFKLFLHDVCDLIEIPFKAKNYRFKRFMTTFKGIISGITYNPKADLPNKPSK
ncbi:glycosyltransferase family 2 protein [Fructilactobacillus myrtifloralis]|uniref:Glycosyltransferase family 2 protein n=1 Tax=Fructilactobacillus myrtifloralis TaxID=2940301 RepID=A0ABY5BM10_9LACO|nr:glycosyltransferase family 2 protein [Fructilactobacillus myrtifloralis]USS84719.1 glycosyltransferase family 2 protein [Fructilactobacillus myrtifloralis]